MKNLFKNLFTYNYRINQSLEDRFKSYDYRLDAEIIRLANHVMNALQVWLDRINGTNLLKSPWENFPIETFALRNHELYGQTTELIESMDPEEISSFKTFAGSGLGKKVSIYCFM